MVVSLSATCSALTLTTRRCYRKMKVIGIIYLYDISQAEPPKYLSILDALCGNDALKNTTLAITTWRVKHPHQSPLSRTCWEKMRRNGATEASFTGTTKSAWDIINPILAKNPVKLDIQNELIDRKMPLTKTAAFHSLPRSNMATKTSFFKRIMESLFG